LSDSIVVDLRSDTVTRPTEAMRQAMARAEVGDDVFREDPTVRRLEERGAAAVGKEAALFVPSGTMGNQIALHVLGRPGREVVCGRQSHIVRYELSAMAVLSGLQPRVLPDEDGVLDPQQVAAAIAVDGSFTAHTALVALESSHNMAGGRVADLAALSAVEQVARRHGLPVHLDGARIFNAAQYLGVPVASLAGVADTVTFCLSKGLGAPVGSLLCASREIVEEGWRVRKMLGGGMRQAGVLAAAGLLALEEGPAHLETDHRHARRLAEALAELPAVEIDPATVHTNIVFLTLKPPATAPGLAEGLKQHGVLAIALAPDRLRLVTHRDVSSSQIDTAIAALRRILG
jgi:threonine aldolase